MVQVKVTSTKEKILRLIQVLWGLVLVAVGVQLENLSTQGFLKGVSLHIAAATVFVTAVAILVFDFE